MDVTLGRPKDVSREHPQDVSRGRPLALHRALYGDVNRISFGEVLRTSSGCKFVEWGTTVDYIEHFLILEFALTGYISISAFASLLGIPIGIASSATGLKFFAVVAGIKKCKSIIKKKKKKHDKIVLLAKSKINSTEVVISKTLIDLKISHDEFVLMKNVQN